MVLLGSFEGIIGAVRAGRTVFGMPIPLQVREDMALIIIQITCGKPSPISCPLEPSVNSVSGHVYSRSLTTN